MAEFNINDRVKITEGPYAGSAGRIVGKRPAKRGSGPAAGDRLPGMREEIVYDINIGAAGIRPECLELLEEDTAAT